MTSGFQGFLNRINDAILNPFIILLFSIALLVFLYGVFQLIRNASDDKARTDAKKAVLWGIVGMFIMISAFGIIRLVLNSTGANTNIYPLVNTP